VKAGGQEYSEDAIFNGEVTVRQRRDGYRFSLDALLLAWYAHSLPGDRVLELGAGCGVVSLALASRRPGLRIDAVEIQRSLYELAKENAEINGFDNVRVINADLRRLGGTEWEGRYDLVLSNPPYREVGRGRLNPEEEKARARHELLSTLGDVVACAARAMKREGNLAVVLLAERSADLDSVAESSGLSVLHRLWVRPIEGRPPNILLARLASGKHGAAEENEMAVYGSPGVYTRRAEAILKGAWGSGDRGSAPD
jgi:tRNA1Val (adenine37-N6)-methyltransferase